LQKARYGISADPSILIESENLEQVVHAMKIVETHRGTLEHLLKQRAYFGPNTPSHIVTQIDSTRQEIITLRMQLKHLGHAIPSHDVDNDSAMASAPAPTTQPLNTMELIKRRLIEVETLLRNGLTDRALDIVTTLQQQL
jgi:hypothetical protein